MSMLRAQVRSCRRPGIASAVQTGRPFGSMIALMFAPKSRCFPEYQSSMLSPFNAQNSFGDPVAVEEFAVEDDERPPVGGGALQRLMQVGPASGQDRDAVGEVAVGSRPGDAEPGAQQCRILLLTEPDQESAEPGKSRSTLLCPDASREPGALQRAAVRGDARVPWARRAWQNT